MNESTTTEGVRLTLTQVAKGVGTSPQNLHKTYIKKGIITVKRDDLGKRYIDLVEVLRVFGERFRLPEQTPPVDAVTNQPVDAVVETVAPGLSTGLSEVLRKNSELEARLAQAEREKADLREQLDDSKELAGRLLNQVDKLTDTLKLLKGPETPPEAPKTPHMDEKKPGWLSRLFGK